MIQVLSIIAGSWPIAIIVIGVATAVVVNRRLKQAMDDSRTIQELRVSQAVVVRNRNDE